MLLIFITILHPQTFSIQINDEIVASSEIPKDGSEQSLSEGFYLVVGVFSNLENVKKFADQLREDGYNCSYIFSNIKNKYYAYLEHTDSIEGIQIMYNQMKVKSEFNGVWILKVKNHTEEKFILKNQSESVGLGIAEDHSKEISQRQGEHHPHHHHHHGHHRDLSVTHN